MPQEAEQHGDDSHHGRGDIRRQFRPVQPVAENRYEYGQTNQSDDHAAAINPETA